MTTANRPQGSIVDKLDRALGALVEQGLTPRAIYLTETDYAALARHATRTHQSATGSTAFLWPTTYKDALVISEKLVSEVTELPVRRTWGRRELASAVYATNGASAKVGLP